MKKLILIISLLLISGLANSEESKMKMKMEIYSTLSIVVEHEFHKICYYQHPLHEMKDFFLTKKFFGKKINSKDSCPYFLNMNDDVLDKKELDSIFDYIELNSITI